MSTATVVLPLHLNPVAAASQVGLADRASGPAYEILLRESDPGDLAAYVDGTLLVDLGDELVLPRDV